MDARAAISNTLQTAQMICNAYLGDLSEAELMLRPHAGCNHLNWQIGHLIASDHNMVCGCYPDALPPLPEGFVEKYSKDNKDNEDPSGFHNREELMQLMASQHEAILKKIDSVTNEELDSPAPEAMQSYAPTVGAALNMVGLHWMMHCGQWVVVRRETGKDVVI